MGTGSGTLKWENACITQRLNRNAGGAAPAADASHDSLTAETRVDAGGSQVLRGVAAYWRMMYPGSASKRRTRLRAIKQRAEAASDASPASDGRAAWRHIAARAARPLTRAVA